MLICIFDYLTTSKVSFVRICLHYSEYIFPPQNFQWHVLQHHIWHSRLPFILPNISWAMMALSSCVFAFVGDAFCLFLGLIFHFIYSSQQIYSLHWIGYVKLYLEDLSGKIFLANSLHEEKKQSAIGFHWYYAVSLKGLDTRSLKELSSPRLSLIIRDSGLSSISKAQVENCERHLIVYRRDSLPALGSPDCTFLTILPLIKKAHLTTSICWRNM